MYVEILDGRYAGQMRDMEPGVAQDLINLGRARAFARPTAATPPLPGGYSGAPVTKAPTAPAIVADTAAPCPVCGRLTGGCCTEMQLEGENLIGNVKTVHAAHKAKKGR
jgi:hypothetical protein